MLYYGRGVAARDYVQCVMGKRRFLKALIFDKPVQFPYVVSFL